MKRYLAIQTLEMADNDNIFQITFDEEPLLEINSGIAGIEDYENNGFYTDLENIKEAYNIAKTLVEANIGEINE